MPRKDTGSNLQFLMLQPGSEFTTTPSGFDTGTREVVCDSSRVETLEPANGTSDADISYIMENGRLRKGDHPWMFVNSCQVVSTENGITRMRLNFLGQKLKKGQSLPLHLKAKTFTTSVESQQVEVGNFTIEVGLQTVEVTYLWLNLKSLPPINASVGLPEYIADKGRLIDAESGVTIPPAYVDYFRLSNRSSIGVGGDPKKTLVPGVGVISHIALSNTRRLYQVTDTVVRTVKW